LSDWVIVSGFIQEQLIKMMFFSVVAKFRHVKTRKPRHLKRNMPGGGPGMNHT